jgi:uncharacterized protein (TIGR02118 family)
LHKLIIQFHIPDDVAEFETRWSNEFVQRAETMPGIQRVTVSRVMGGPGEALDLHLVHEFYFADLDAVRSAMVSPAGRVAGSTLMAITGGKVSLCYAEHMEEDRV